MRTESAQCPLQIPCYYQVRFSTDPDEPIAAVPSCCVWTESGLSTIPTRGSADVALQHVAGKHHGLLFLL